MGDAWEAVMNGQNTDFRNSKAIVGVAVVNIVLATLIYALGGAPARDFGLFSNVAWVILELVRSVVLLAHWAAVSAYLYEGQRVLQRLPEIAASVVPLVCALAG
jgi:hypothetical protein